MTTRGRVVACVLGCALGLASACESDGPGGDGFDPRTHGFPFQNYGNDVSGLTNLTEAEVQRAYGDAVCESGSGPECSLTAPARQWMEQVNGMMGGGHCEGMAVLSLRMFHGTSRPADFGGDTAHALGLDGNAALQREIAYYFALQTLDAVGNAAVEGTPSEQAQRLRASLMEGGEPYTIAFFKPGFTDGHAVSPYDVRDREDGTVEIVVYDNNFPDEERILEVDPMAETWRYSAAASPDVPESLYEGDASTNTLNLRPLSSRDGIMPCPFCGERTGGAEMPRQVATTGDASVLIQDMGGQRVGHMGDGIVNEISGARVLSLTSDLWEDRAEPIYALPDSRDIDIYFSGDDGPTSEGSVGVFGPGVYAGVENVMLDAGQMDLLRVFAGGEAVTYETSGMETPDVVMAYSTDAADWVVAARTRGDSDGQTVDMQVNTELGDLHLWFTGSDAESEFDLYLLRVDGDTELEFWTERVVVPNGARLRLRYGEFDADGEMLVLEVDVFGDGTTIETIDLLDVEGGL